MSLRAIIHLGLHVAVPARAAWLWFSLPSRVGWPGTGSSGTGVAGTEERFGASMFLRAWLVLLLGWVIDLDHLLADPIYPPTAAASASTRCIPRRRSPSTAR